jgi:hypothetical protein
MRKAILTAAAILLLTTTAWAVDPKGGEADKAQDFSFQGLHFRMTREQVRALYPTANPEATEIRTPGHGMMFLNLGYDHRDRLMEIRASYQRPDTPLADEGLRRALRDRWVAPVTAKYRNVAVSVDEYGNRAAMTVVFLSQDVREESINFFRDEMLKKLD